MIDDVGIRSRKRFKHGSVPEIVADTGESRANEGDFAIGNGPARAMSGPAFRHFAKQLMILRLEPLRVA